MEHICKHCGAYVSEAKPDPFESEMNDDYTPVWLCDSCRADSSEEV